LLTSVDAVVIFSAVWFGLKIAKGLINPIEKLVEGTAYIPGRTWASPSMCSRRTSSASR
jgi:hypothetical protein